MIPLPLEALAEVVGGELADPADGDRVVDAVTIDSRTARPGTLFVPLPGEHADGHAFIGDAVSRGAAGYFCAADKPAGPPGAIVVDDPADALLGLGGWVRDEVDPLVVAVTGSNGKTTTKDFIAAAVGAGRRVVASERSFNNDLGVPLTACRLAVGDEVLVAEVGSRGLGHIAALAPLLRPDVAVVTSVAGAHLSEFGSIDVVAAAKAELVEALDPSGLAVLNADDSRVAAMAAVAPGDVVTFGQADGANWHATDVALDARACASFTVRGVRVVLGVPGAHNVGNALAALAVAERCDVPLADAAAALAKAAVSPWRMELGTTPDGVTVLNDAYNANPASMTAALATLAAMAVTGRRWAVLGRMAELGDAAGAGHEEVGRAAVAAGVDGLVVVGAAAEPIAAAARAAGFAGRAGLHTVAEASDAEALLARELRTGDVVLVKASRAVGLEALALNLLAGPGQ